MSSSDSLVYKIILHVVLILVLWRNVNLIFFGESNIISFAHILSIFWIYVCLFFDSKFLIISIRIWSVLLLLGPILRVINIMLSLVLGEYEKILLYPILLSSINLLVGVILFVYAKSLDKIE